MWRHLQFKQLGDQDGLVAFGAVAAETQGPFIDVALFAPSFTYRALATQAALVHGVGHQRTAPTELSAQLTLVDVSKLDVAESERLLAVSRGAIASLRTR